MWTRSQTVFAFVALIGITACDVPDNPTRQQGGEIQVQLTKGLNFYSDECFRYAPAGSIDVCLGSGPLLACGLSETNYLHIDPANSSTLPAYWE